MQMKGAVKALQAQCIPILNHADDEHWIGNEMADGFRGSVQLYTSTMNSLQCCKLKGELHRL